MAQGDIKTSATHSNWVVISSNLFLKSLNYVAYIVLGAR